MHAIGDDGNVGELLQWLDTKEHEHSIQTDPTNRLASVPHANPANAIYQFGFDDELGALTPNDPSKVQSTTEEGPRHFLFHPCRDLLYSINENGCTVSAHRFDPEFGTLTGIQIASTLP